MNEKFIRNAKVEKFTSMLGIAVRLIVIDPYYHTVSKLGYRLGYSTVDFICIRFGIAVKNAKQARITK